MNTITAEELSEHIHTLASPAFEGRYTGSEGIRMAAEYIRNDFKKMGLESGISDGSQAFFQTFVLEKCHWQDQQLSFGNIFLSPVRDYIFLSDPQQIEGEYEVIFSGFGLDDEKYSDYSELDVGGKLVMAFSGEPKDKEGHYFISGQKEPSRQAYYFSKMRVAKEKGAAGLIIVPRKEKDIKKYTRGMENYRDRADIRYPGDAGQEEFFAIYMDPGSAAEVLGTGTTRLKKMIRETENEQRSMSGKYRGQLNVTTSSECFPMNSENVVGLIEGTDLKDEAVVVVAHYDHLGKRGDDIYFGADDNASGTAAVLEIAEAFSLAGQDGKRPRRTVIFMAVSAEELGLHGSRYYSENPVVPMEQTYACVNIDMIGRAGTKYKDEPDYIGGMAYVSEDILDIAKEASLMAAPELRFEMAYRERVSGGSDHYYFARSGIPSLFYFTGIHKDYHEPTDTPDKILYDRMEGITRSIFTTIWELANRQEKLRIEN